MKKLFLLPFIFFLALFGVSPAVAADQTITFSTTNARFIPKFINGINQNWFVETPYNYNFNLEAFDRIGTNLVRFPGGTVANYYNWATFAPDWAAGAQISPGLVASTKSRFESFVQTLDPIAFIRGFNQHGKQVSLTLNVFSNTPEQIAIGLIKIKAAGLTPKYFELGNEMYQYTSMTEYFQKSKLAAQKVKAIFPDAKIGIVGRKGLWSTDQERDWPEGDDPPNENWFDAVIFHPYMGSGSQMPPARQINHILFDPAVKLSDLVSRVNTKYPGKKLWLTEWNIWETNNSGLFMTETYSYAVFHYNFILSMLKFPDITVANHHVLWTASAPQFSLLYPKQAIRDQYYKNSLNPPNNTYSFDQFFVKSPAFWPMKWIGQAFSQYSKFTLIDNEVISSAYFFNPNQPEQGGVAVINKTEENQQVTFNGIGSQSRTASVLAKDWLAENSEANEMRPTTKSVTNAITLPPYAIAYLSPQNGAPTQNPADFTDEGDTPGDEVNIFDYNVLIAGFGTTYDIFDYNTLVGRFGE